MQTNNPILTILWLICSCCNIFYFLCTLMWTIELWKKHGKIVRRLSFIDKIISYYLGFTIYCGYWIKLVIMSVSKSLWVLIWLNWLWIRDVRLEWWHVDLTFSKLCSIGLELWWWLLWYTYGGSAYMLYLWIMWPRWD